MIFRHYPPSIIPEGAVPDLSWPVARIAPRVGVTTFTADSSAFRIVAKDTPFSITGEVVAFYMVAKDTPFYLMSENTIFHFRGENNAGI